MVVPARCSVIVTGRKHVHLTLKIFVKKKERKNPLVDKILNYVLQYSRDNNLIILTGNKSNDLYITDLNQKVASLHSVASHFPSV